MSADDTSPVSRRGFLRAAAGTAAASAAAGHAAAQEGNETATGTPGGNETATGTPGGNETETGTASGNESDSGSSGGGGGGTEEVIVGPGGSLVFEPAEIEITPGTTVNWVWESDGHNVVPESQPDGANWEGTGGESELFDTGYEYSHTFETEGDYEYVCVPHAQAGMTGTVTVSEDAGGGGGGGGGGPPAIPDSAKTLGIAATMGMASTLGLAYFLMRYGGDYEQES